MRRAALAGLAVLTSALCLHAQQCRIQVVEPRFLASPRGSLVWYRNGCELVEAMLATDLRAARRLCDELVAAAPSAAVPGCGPVSLAVTGLVVAHLDGPKHAESWFDRAHSLPDGVDHELRVHFHLARVRYSCLSGAHDAEAHDWLAAEAAAAATDRHLLRVRVFATGAHHLPQRSIARLAQLSKAAEAAGQADEIHHLRHLTAVEEFNRAEAESRPSDKVRLCDEIARTAEADGNRRQLATAKATRANQMYVEGRRAEAIAIYREVERDYELLGDRRELFGVRNMLAWTSMHTKAYDQVEQWIERNRELIDGAGFDVCEKELLRLRFTLAVDMEKGELAAELKRQFDAAEGSEAAVVRRTEQLREKLVAAERDREAAEERFVAEQKAAAERLAEARTVGAVVVVAALFLLVGISWRSRRRLMVANARLAEQVRAVEAAKVAQQQLEERMRELERVESLGTMAAGIAHDFNNLLTSIVGSAEMLQHEGVERDRVELARTIHLAGDQAARLCRQLQAYAGGTPTQRVPLDLLAMAREMLPALQAATKGHAEVSLESPDGAVGVLGDRAQLEQVLLNLVVNARDANAREVRITLDRVPEAPVGADGVAAPAEARLQVADDGDGMSSDVQHRIFDPFFTTRFPGRGLGLAVVHGVVRRHSGRITVASTPGEGATFTITLPCASAPTPAVEVPRTVPAMAGSRRQIVFVCDDDAAVRGMLARMLTASGVVAHVVEDGEALLVAVANAPASQAIAAFVDLSMPTMDGVEVVRRLRSMRGNARVVLMSGHPQTYVDQVAGDLQIDGVLTKPFMLDGVRAMLLRLLTDDPVATAGV
ncbi:MAG: response regulator [Planctomycetes bacterium]|nr:response regulator [Planctomycetota bacterium]